MKVFDNKTKVIEEVVDNISEFKENDIKGKLSLYSKEKVGSIFLRLNNGKKNFEDISEIILESLMKISNTDLQLKDKEEKVGYVSNDILSLMDNLKDKAELVLRHSEEVSKLNYNIGDNIEQLSNNSKVLKEDAIKNEQDLFDIKVSCQNTVKSSKNMKEDMKNLMNILENLKGVIESILSISEQTNLLALNASIEAARAGEMGKGFAVVADEIRKLADETKSMTSNMGRLVEYIGEASIKSQESVDTSVNSLEDINKKLESIVNTGIKNKEVINNIVSNIEIVSKDSNKIDEAFDEVLESVKECSKDVEVLNSSSESLKEAREGLREVILPLSDVEGDLSRAASLVGRMVNDPYYRMKNERFIEIVNNAIGTHKIWINKLESMVKTREIKPLQVDEHKCAFGHFYYSIKPQNEEILKLWNDIEGKHRSLHGYGKKVIASIRVNDENKAKSDFKEAVNISKELINDFNEMINIAKILADNGKSIFEK